MFFFQMIEAQDAKTQENALSRSNSIRRPNAIIVADDEADAEISEQRSLSSRCCGGG